MEGAENVDLAMSFIRSEMGGEDENDSEEKSESHVLKEQDRFLPIANVARLMKKGIPRTGKVAKDARECVQECVSEFISFITSEASDRCHQEKRKTINGEDILWAMNTLGFESYVEPLKIYLQKFRDVSKGEKMDGDAYDEYGNMGSFGTDGVPSSDIISGYAGQGSALSQTYSL